MAPNRKDKMVSYLGLGEANTKARFIQASLQGGEERSALLAQRDRLNVTLQSLERNKYDSRRRQNRHSSFVSHMTLECQQLTLLQIELAERLVDMEQEIVKKYIHYKQTEMQMMKVKCSRKHGA